MSRRAELEKLRGAFRFEHPDPDPLESALPRPRRQSMRDLVAQYVRGHQAMWDDDGTWDVPDPEHQVISEYQLVALAEEWPDPPPPAEQAPPAEPGREAAPVGAEGPAEPPP